MITIAVDAMGGDHAPDAIVKGIAGIFSWETAGVLNRWRVIAGYRLTGSKYCTRPILSQ